ncbi:ribbon-helix-helix domain-containing protein [Rhizobium lemnae]|uniref:Ribbon-helix-helix protein, CopG family n=1 Tax=Rhizobium lemnae TaxID=1214924 RepID=A0ABV8EEM1_9HYPH|nr:ribbon-helix-helix domain-containing protein [Rhizobium lemnae]MCJ8510285.1 ribbon-helix-helix domain-containing protein [Rhizobium lemnae]
MTFYGSFDAKITRSKMRGCDSGRMGVTTNIMSHAAKPVKERVVGHRARQLAAGRVVLNTYVPGDLLEALDRIKEKRGAQSRMPLIEEALRLLIERETRA